MKKKFGKKLFFMVGSILTVVLSVYLFFFNISKTGQNIKEIRVYNFKKHLQDTTWVDTVFINTDIREKQFVLALIYQLDSAFESGQTPNIRGCTVTFNKFFLADSVTKIYRYVTVDNKSGLDFHGYYLKNYGTIYVSFPEGKWNITMDRKWQFLENEVKLLNPSKYTTILQETILVLPPVPHFELELIDTTNLQLD